MFEILKNHKGPLISESGIKDEKDAKYIYEKTGIKNFLIGESLLIQWQKQKSSNIYSY